MNIVVFLTTYICTNNLFLLFDNTTGMTHLKITDAMFCRIVDITRSRHRNEKCTNYNKIITFSVRRL